VDVADDDNHGTFPINDRAYSLHLSECLSQAETDEEADQNMIGNGLLVSASPLSVGLFIFALSHILHSHC